jgi:hypothetical protein
MRKVICIVCIVLATMALLLASPLPGQAGGPRFHGGIWIGPGPGWWGPGPWWGPPAYWGSPYPYYATPPVIVQQQSPAYIQPAPQPEESNYWYYCQDTQTYYPYVKQCPSAWMKVVPSPASPGR